MKDKKANTVSVKQREERRKHASREGSWLLPIFMAALLCFTACSTASEDAYTANTGSNVKVETADDKNTPEPAAPESTEPAAKELASPAPTEPESIEPVAPESTEPVATESTPVPAGKLAATTIVEKVQGSKIQLSTDTTVTSADIPENTADAAYAAINDNVPYFADNELTTASYEFYSELDSLGRCGVAYACIGQDSMPTEERGSIGQVKPSGWHTVKYDCVDGNYLYNRCHLIGYQLTGENANEKNLITGTRSMNVDGMLPFENMVADYVKETNNHVMYRVTPVYEGDNLLADGVLMEAKSVEDNGEGILFNVFVYNSQDGVLIDYATGDSQLKEESAPTSVPTEKATATPKPTEKATPEPEPTEKVTEPQVESTDNEKQSVMVWISETGSKYHNKNNCGRMNPDKAYQMSEEDAKKKGYEPCKKCY